MNKRIKAILEEIGKLDTMKSTEDIVAQLIDLYAECMAEMLRERILIPTPREPLDLAITPNQTAKASLTDHVGKQYVVTTDKGHRFSKGEVVTLDDCKTETLGVFFNEQKEYQYLYSNEVVRITETVNQLDLVGLRCVVIYQEGKFDAGTLVTVVKDYDGVNLVVANEFGEEDFAHTYNLGYLAEQGENLL